MGLELVKLEKKKPGISDEKFQELVKAMKNADGFLCVLKTHVGQDIAYDVHTNNLYPSEKVYASEIVKTQTMLDAICPE
jgi:hypothetical protein